jgi:hypothetical protein
MTPGKGITMNTSRQRLIATLMGFEALTLAVISPLHLSGVLGGGAKPFNPTAAGTAEAVIGVVLVLGALGLGRGTARGRDAAVAATAFAIIGFFVGLSFTLRGGDAIDVAYHAVMLPLLFLTMVALLRRRPTRSGSIGPQCRSLISRVELLGQGEQNARHNRLLSPTEEGQAKPASRG